MLADAKAGDFSALKTLTRRFQISVDLLTAEVVEALLSHLDESKLPGFHSDPLPSATASASDGALIQRTSPSVNVLRAQTIILGFEDGFENIAELRQRHREIDPILIARWNGVHKWMWYFLGMVVGGQSHSNDSLIESLVNFISFYKWLDGAHELIDGTPGALKLVTLLWLQHRNLTTLRPSGCILLSTFIGRRITKKRSFDEILDAVDGEAAIIVDALLEPYRLFLSTPTPFLQARVATTVDFFYLLTYRPKHILCRQLLEKNAIPLVIRSILYCIEYPSLMVDLRGVIFAVFHFLGRLAYCTPGETWAIQAFRAGLPELFIKCWPIFARMENEEHVEKLSRAFAYVSCKYLCNLQVVQAAGGALFKAIRNVNLDSIGVQAQCIGAAWCIFHHFVDTRLSIAENMDACGIRMNRQICDVVSSFSSGCRQHLI